MAFLDFLHAVVANRHLEADEAEQAMGSILDGTAGTPQIAAFLVALRMKGETAAEVLGFARAMRARSARVDPGPLDAPLVDTCGTGGDGHSTFNISTVAALVAAGAGVRVAKHGNRSYASHCGSADILEALGVKIALTPDQMAACLREAGIAFLFAPALHPAMKHAAPARQELKMRTVLNLLGPLTNPAGAPYQLIGAPSEGAAELMASALSQLGSTRAFVVHGSDGMDEITITGTTLLLDVTPGAVERRVLDPRDFGIARASLADLSARTKEENVRIAREVLAGHPGPPRNIVVMNAGAALVTAGVAGDFREGAAMAARSIDSGAAAARLEALVRHSTIY